MLKERHRYGVAQRTPCASSRAPHRNIVPPEVGIIPGNRFFLLPLKKVSALVRHHDPCRGSSATSTKTCIETKATNRPMTGNAGGHTDKSLRSSNRLIVRGSMKQIRRHPAIAKTHLGPISEQEQEEGKPLLDDQGNGPWKQGTGLARIRKLHLERAENARRMNTHIYFRKARRQEDLNPRRFTQKIASEPLERVLPRGASAIDYLSLVMVESAQQSAPVVSTGLTSRAAVVTKCKSPTEGWSQNRCRSKCTSVFNLDQPAQQTVETHRKLGSQGDRESLGGSPQPVLYPSDDLMQKRGTRLTKTSRVSTERESVSDLAATALKHEGLLSYAHLRTVDGQPRRKGNKKLRNLVVLPRMQAFGRNRVSPSDHQFLLAIDQFSEKNSIIASMRDSFGRSDEVISKRFSYPRRVRCRDEENSFVGCSVVHRTRSAWTNPFLCSLTNQSDLPIGPLRGSLKEQLLK